MAREEGKKQSFFALNLLEEQVANYEWEAHVRTDLHEEKAQFFSRFATPVAWTAAATSGISTLSIVTDNDVIAAIFAILTILQTTFLAAVKPAETAADHQTAANSFDQLHLAFRALAYDIPSVVESEYVAEEGYDPETKQKYDAGYWSSVDFDKERFAALRQVFDDLRARWDDVKAKSPAVRMPPQKRERDDGGDAPQVSIGGIR